MASMPPGLPLGQWLTEDEERALSPADAFFTKVNRAATKLQQMYRARQGRMALRHMMLSVYRKVPVEDSDRGEGAQGFYYINLKTGVSSWEKPFFLAGFAAKGSR